MRRKEDGRTYRYDLTIFPYWPLQLAHFVNSIEKATLLEGFTGFTSAPTFNMVFFLIDTSASQAL